MKYDERVHDVVLHLVESMAQDLPMQDMLDQLTRRTVSALEIDGAGLMIMREDGQMHFVSASDGTLAHIEHLQIESGEGPCLRAYRTGEVVLVPDLSNDERFTDFGPKAAEHGLAAVFSFPMRHNGDVIGAADLYRGVAGPPSEDDRQIGEALASIAAAFIVNARMRMSARDLAEDLRRQTLHDPLTGLPNRRLLHDRIDHALARSQRSGRLPAVLFLDLDRFKDINDTLGHRMGDRLLIAVAERLQGVVRPGDTLARLSGDEFAIVCADLHECAEAHRIADRVAGTFDDPFTVDGHRVRIGGSIGVACAEDGDTDPDDLLHGADEAMYRVKAGRRRPSDGHVGRQGS